MKSSRHLVALLAAACGLFSATALAEDSEAGFKAIFDGKSLEGWDGNPQFWSVQDGALSGQTTAENPTEGNTFIIWRGGKLEDFELRLKFRIVGGNSGVQYRSQEQGDKWVVGGYQADIDSGKTYIGILYDERGRGILAQRGQKVVLDEGKQPEVVGETTPSEKILEAIKWEDWNDYTIVARGNHLVQKINGLTTVDVTDNQTAHAEQSGILAFQLHAGPPMLVQFKDVRLKTLK